MFSVCRQRRKWRCLRASQRASLASDARGRCILESMIRVIPPILLLILGVIIYWLFRPEIYLFQFIQVSNPAPVGVDDNLFLLFLKNHFADAAWCMALLLIVRLLKTYDVPRGYTFALLSLPFLSELLQAVPRVPGTFDWIDLTIYLALYALVFHREISEMKNTLKHIVGAIALTTFVAGVVGSSSPPPRRSYTPAKPVKYITGTFTIAQMQDEFFTKKSLTRILRTSKTPSVVLRVPVAGKNVAAEQKQKNSVLYNTIEKEFAKAGYAVRDRALFAQVLEREKLDYSQIGLLTKTDLILELLSFQEVPYKVREYRDEGGDLAEASKDITFTGATVEFKLVSVKENDLVGAYTFHYTPCTFACTHKFSISKPATLKVKKSIPVDFFKDSAKHLIRELQKAR